MSLNVARKPQAVPAPPARTPRRRLEPVVTPTVRRRPKLAYALVALGGAMAIGAAQIGLSLAITQDSFTLASLSSQQNELNLQTQALQEELTGLSSPQALAASAAGLGMVVAGSPSYLRLSDGAVFGAGSGAAGTSTIDPTGAGAVGNALLQPVEKETAAEDAGTATEQGTDPLPPAIADGLPSPTTR
ncbi:hypothetical protein [Microbacterium hydrocarbonoxydans]|uniref:hypothetical protein n=1 Tax=Microbacterium hydrocarbonoxydans TaxID=273678 RepID=UPI0007BB4BFF|nr:hypothetical protein [Microbacterium hydrocarbonoxydans]GAT73509.1 hypothetical protein MHM582_2003 [Microbacterium sp. HM58-2]